VLEYETEIDLAGYGVDALVTYEWDDVVTGDRVTGRTALIDEVFLDDGDGWRVDVTALLDKRAIDALREEIESSDDPDTATRNRWRNNARDALGVL